MVGSKRCILVVDDEPKMIRAIQDFLNVHEFVVIPAFNGQEALDVYYEHNADIDLVLLDVMMPIYNGYEVLEDIRRNHSLTPVILLTARGEEYDQVKGFQAGADDYITKPFSPSLLLARIESLLRRVGKTTHGELVRGRIVLNTTNRSVSCSGNPIQLTKREFELLFFFLSNPSLIFTRDQILNSVWGYDFEGDSRTVDTHVKQLRVKLQEDACYIKTVHRIGYQFEVPNE